nr:FRWamide [Urechis unicinctus]
MSVLQGVAAPCLVVVLLVAAVTAAAVLPPTLHDTQEAIEQSRDLLCQQLCSLMEEHPGCDCANIDYASNFLSPDTIENDDDDQYIWNDDLEKRANIFRWGKRAAPGILRWGKRAAPGIFRWGKRSSPSSFHWGRDASDFFGGNKRIFRWGKRGSVFKWGKRDDQDASIDDDNSLNMDIKRGKGVFRWGKRSTADSNEDLNLQ